MNWQKNKKFFISFFSMCFLLVLTYIPTWKWMYERWTASNSYISHGFFIPFISLWILWNDRNKVLNTQLNPNLWGLALIFLGLLIHVLSGIARIHFTSGFSIPFTVLGVFVLLAGKKGFSWAWFPSFYLFCMIPFPLVLISFFTLKLKLIAAEITVIILDILGIVAVREGSIISFLHAQMIVGDVCSGLRSLVSMIALGIPLAYITKTTIARKCILLALLPPIAFIVNIIRVLFLAVATYIWGNGVASGSLHDISGMVALFFNILILVFLGRKLSIETIEQSSQEKQPKTPSQLLIKPNFLYYFSAILCFFLAATMTHFFLYQHYTIEQTKYSDKFPKKFGRWRINQEYPIDKNTIQILETSDILMSNYQKDRNQNVLLALVVSNNSNRKISHPPEICYKGAGCEIIEKKHIQLKNHQAVFLQLFNGRYNEIVIYWYKFGKTHTANFYYHQTNALFNFFKKEQEGAALIRISTKLTNINQDFIKLQQFANDIYPVLNKHLP